MAELLAECKRRLESDDRSTFMHVVEIVRYLAPEGDQS